MSNNEELLAEVGTNTAKFMKDFSTNYLKSYIMFKIKNAMNETISNIMPSKKSDEEEEDKKEKEKPEKEAAETKLEIPSYVAGVSVISYHSNWGLDDQWHRYYDLCCFNIKPKDSIITKCVRRHIQLNSFIINKLKKEVNETPHYLWPKTKLFNKDYEFYCNRFKQMIEFFESSSKLQNVSTNEFFLQYFNLHRNENYREKMEIFNETLEQMCEESSEYNWNWIKWRAQYCGLEMDQIEMLKFVACEKIGKPILPHFYESVDVLPNFLHPAKNKLKNMAKSKIWDLIGHTVETTWRSSEEKFLNNVQSLDKTIEKCLEPIQEILLKSINCILPILKQKLNNDKKIESNEDEKKEKDDKINHKIDYQRFSNLTQAINKLSDSDSKEKSINILKELIESIHDMNNCYKYVCYLNYNFNQDIEQFIPDYKDIENRHLRLCVIISDVGFVLARSAAYALEPLFQYIDYMMEKDFNEKLHDKKLQDVIREGGKRLAMDYFALPNMITRSSWYSSEIEEEIKTLANNTMILLADLLGYIGMNYKPTSKLNIKSSLIELLLPLLNHILENYIKKSFEIIQQGTLIIISNHVVKLVHELIDTRMLSDACRNLPSPIGNNLKEDDFIIPLIKKLSIKLTTQHIKILSKSSEQYLFNYNSNPPKPLNEYTVNCNRYTPYLRQYDKINYEPLEEETYENPKDKSKQTQQQPSNDGR